MAFTMDPQILTKKLFRDGRLQASQADACKAWDVSENTYYNYARIIIKAGYAAYIGNKTRGSKRNLAITATGKKLIGVATPAASLLAPSNDNDRPAGRAAVADRLSIPPELLSQFSNALSAISAFNERSSSVQLGIVIAQKEVAT